MLLLATMAILATFSPAGAMERPAQRLITSADPVESGEGQFEPFNKKMAVKIQKKTMQKSGEGDNALVYQRNPKRTPHMNLYNPDSAIQPKKNPNAEQPK